MRYWRFLLVALLYPIVVMAQREEFIMGCECDPVADGQALMQAPLLKRDYTSLPRSYSLKKYCPRPMTQSIYGTCTSWATTYAARTIAEAVCQGWTNTEIISSEAFAPLFIYRMVADSSGCKHGTSIGKSLETMKNIGVPKKKSFDVLCAEYIPDHILVEAKKYKIDNFTKLFYDTWHPPYKDNTWGFDTPGSTKIRSVKKALVEGRPVIIDQDCYNSFSYAWRCELWNGIHDNPMRGGHALCVVGYDDDKFGGAFEIMNSWGVEWGKGGFIWVKYDDFCNSVKYAYDMYVKKKSASIPVPTPKSNHFSGSMTLVRKDGNTVLPLVLNNTGTMAYYKSSEVLLSGARFQLIVRNDEPAWVYVITKGNSGKTAKLFPQAGYSAALTYRHNNIALPDEQHEYSIGGSSGTDTFCVLYSQEELDIDAVLNLLSMGKGSFTQRLAFALGDRMVSRKDIHYKSNAMTFKAQSEKTVLPLIVEIEHKDVNVNYK